MSYDPERRRSRRGRVPPQLRAWVYRGVRKPKRRTHDPSKRVTRRRSYAMPRRRRRYDPQGRYARVKARAKGWGAKLSGWIDKLALPLGGAIGILNDPMGGGRGFNGMWAFMKGAIEHYKPDKILSAIHWSTYLPMYRDSYYAGIGLGVGGTIVMALKLHPIVSKLAKFVRNFGIGLATATFFAAILWLPQSISSPPKGYDLGSKGNPSNPQEAPYG